MLEIVTESLNLPANVLAIILGENLVKSFWLSIPSISPSSPWLLPSITIIVIRARKKSPPAKGQTVCFPG